MLAIDGPDPCLLPYSLCSRARATIGAIRIIVSPVAELQARRPLLLVPPDIAQQPRACGNCVACGLHVVGQIGEERACSRQVTMGTLITTYRQPRQHVVITRLSSRHPATRSASALEFARFAPQEMGRIAAGAGRHSLLLILLILVLRLLVLALFRAVLGAMPHLVAL